MIDDLEKQAAADIEQGHLRWMVMWGCYSRLFWAFPRFLVPKGTIISAPDREHLLVGMHSVEAEASADSRVPAYEPPRPAARLPVRLTSAQPTPLRPTPGQAQRGALPVATAPVDASGWQAQSARANYDPNVSEPYVYDPNVSEPYVSEPYGSGPYGSGPYGSDPDDSDRYGSDPVDSDRYGFDPDDYHASWQRS